MASNGGSTTSREITVTLLRRIINGTYAAGIRLPTERELSQEFGVTRNVIREALKRIEALGLISIRQGSGIFVKQDRKSEIDLVYLFLFKDDGSIDRASLHDLLEYHNYQMTAVCKLGAQRITKKELKIMKKLIMERREILDDEEKLIENFYSLASVLTDAAHNKYFYLTYSTVLRTTVLMRGQAIILAREAIEAQELFENLVEDYESRDAEAAASRVSHFLELHLAKFQKIILQLDWPPIG